MINAPELDIDEDGYPTEDSLEQLQRWLDENPELSAEFMLGPFCETPRYITGCSIERYDVDEKRTAVTFHTGGWSGAESYIETILRCGSIYVLYYAKWERGGHYTFIVPIPKKEDAS